ncbi:LPS export ABC transporter ATP-binding protein [Rhodovulum sulfidophilum]|nr:LPS export ABC transporter ATP-binding protein [Rhodovulum sulfidophilum]MBL3559914.1 LPS export ABC transporter ATP-binding protein [Rhodovulum sulfidophilum]
MPGPAGGLRIVDLRKSYRRRPVIRDVSLRLDRGEVVALLGPNGSGKTTCFYAVAGLLTPDGGKVMLDGRDVTTLPMYRRARLGIGYLPQEVSIFRGLDVEDNIKAVLEIVEPDRHKRRERLEELLSEFSIEHLRRAPALSLSGGERRRVEIARCLAADPSYLLLDEPFAGVDPIAVGEIRALVADLKTRGIGVLITDHNVRETLEIVDRAYILHDGKVLMSGTTQEVIRDENVRRVYLGQSFRIT